MTLKGYFPHTRSPELNPHRQIQLQELLSVTVMGIWKDFRSLFDTKRKKYVYIYIYHLELVWKTYKE